MDGSHIVAGAFVWRYLYSIYMSLYFTAAEFKCLHRNQNGVIGAATVGWRVPTSDHRTFHCWILLTCPINCDWLLVSIPAFFIFLKLIFQRIHLMSTSDNKYIFLEMNLVCTNDCDNEFLFPFAHIQWTFNINVFNEDSKGAWWDTTAASHHQGWGSVSLGWSWSSFVLCTSYGYFGFLYNRFH